MKIQSPVELLVHELSAIRDAETQASQALQRQLPMVETDELRQFLELRLEQGKRLLQEVTQSVERLGGSPKGEQNAAARGLIEESQKLVEMAQTPELKQVVMIAGVQKLEHYCIAAWGTVKAIANELGQQELVHTMQNAVDEGYRLDRELSDLAESWVNPTAIEEADQAEGGKK
jgi:ferritin-like metal-binding protein YciE